MIKTIALVLLTLTSLTLAGLLIRERQRTAQQTQRASDAETLVAKQREEIQTTRAAVSDLEQKRAQLVARNKAAKQAVADAMSNAATPAPDVSPAAAVNEVKKKKPANPFADSITKMMKDPAMKNMLRSTQAMSIKKMYGDLVRQWSLSPEETQTFYDLLLDKQMDQMDQGMNFLEKGAASIDAAHAPDPDAKLKASLGDNFYKQYQDYQKTISGRLTINQYQEQLLAGNTPALTPDQSATLLQTITEENANRPAGTSSLSNGQGQTGFSMDAAQVDQFVKTQGDLNDRIDARMANSLSADQLRVLKEEQQQMLTTQRMGMEMAAKMMVPSPTP